ncbi:MAG: response regulator [Chloroflexi bacterium]|nr:response regulator [Chloroflexota bacterium]
MPARRILLVDDQREVTRLLRTSLELLNRDYVIVDVPSGEEALLEVQRTPFDLLVTDVRLPGIDGLTLINRVRRANAAAKIILITGESPQTIEAEVKRIAPFAYFSKPISTDKFLDAAQDALGEKTAPAKIDTPANGSPAISDRLASLRRDLGALAVFLADLDGRVVLSAGDIARLDVTAVLQPLVTTFSASLKVCSLLGGLVPTNVQFFDGDDYDLYTLNVGQFFLLVIVFDGDRGGTAMGAVMRFGRICADDLLNALAEIGVEEALRKPAPAPPAPAAPPIPDTVLDEVLKKTAAQDVHAFWDAAAEEALAEETKANALSFEQAQKLGLVPKELTK